LFALGSVEMSADILGTLRNHGLDLSCIAAHWTAGYDVVKNVNEFQPNFATVGFVVSYVVVVLCFPILLGLALYAVWSLAKLGPARKTFSTILIVGFGVPLYPILAFLTLAIFWIILGVATLGLAVALPMFCAAILIIQLRGELSVFVDHQREMNQEDELVVEDITFVQLFFGIVMGCLSFCTFGVLAMALTLLKSPLVLGSCVVHGVRHSLPAFTESGNWCPLVFLVWCFAFVGGCIVVILGILVSMLVKLVAAGLWPAYVFTGWLRIMGGRRRNDVGLCAPVRESLKAGYQVLWASDLLTNACITMRFDLLKQSCEEFGQMVVGLRSDLSPECRAVACLPAVTIGLLHGWEITAESLARQLCVPKLSVTDAWDSFAREMKRVGREALDTGVLTEDFVLSVPPELIIGLPARVLLDTVERSSGPDIVLASGLRLTEAFRPKTDFGKMVWREMQTAMAVRASADLPHDARTALCGALLAGGGDPEELPQGLAAAVQAFESMGPPWKEPCDGIYRALIAVSLECSRQSIFKSKLEEVLQALTKDDPAEALLASEPDSCSDDDSSSSESEPASP